MAKTSADAEATMIANLREKTGKSLEQWVELAGRSGRSKHGEIVSYLKTEQGLTHGYANLVAHRLLQSSAAAADPADLVAAQYAGPKAALRPIYDALVAAVQRLGPDVELAPKKAYVSVRRTRQFAMLQPSTAQRFDVGLTLKGVEPHGRLEASGSFSAMVSHRVRLTRVEEVDRELLQWLKAAYEAA